MDEDPEVYTFVSVIDFRFELRFVCLAKRCNGNYDVYPSATVVFESSRHGIKRSSHVS